MADPSHRPARPKTLGQRLLRLLLSLAAGAGVAGLGLWLTGEQAWYLAVPFALAIGWLFTANPAECEPPADRRPSRRRPD